MYVRVGHSHITTTIVISYLGKVLLIYHAEGNNHTQAHRGIAGHVGVYKGNAASGGTAPSSNAPASASMPMTGSGGRPSST